MKYSLRGLLIILCFTFAHSNEQYLNNDDTGIYEAINARTTIAQNKNGKFFGVVAGGSLFLPSDAGVKLMPTLGVKGGTYTFFNPYIGVSGFVDFAMGAWKSAAIFAIVSLGINTIAEFPLSTKRNVYLGGILGIGGNAYIFYDEVHHNTFSNMQKRAQIFMQGGITLMLGKPSRISVIYRFIPSKKASQFNPNGLVMLEYTFKF